MTAPIRKFLGATGLSLLWAAVWGAVFAALVLAVGILRPQDVGPGEGPLVATATGLLVGLVSGAVFSVLVAFAEDGKSVRDLAVARVALWGTAAGAVWPLTTAVDDGMLLVLCPLGAFCAAASVLLARRANPVGRFFAKPLSAVTRGPA